MPNREFKHGDKRTWELAVNALADLGGKATAKDILARIRRTVANYVESNLLADLSAVSVNSPSRGQYSPNYHPRRTDAGNEYDRAFKRGVRKSVIYELYDPVKHGVWELYLDPNGKTKVREISGGMAERALEAARFSAEAEHIFDPTSIEDARRRMFGAIVLREGQPRFRQELIRAYDGKCAISGCALVQVLEAAHIHPYRGKDTNCVSNGLLLRADIHTLFDLGLIWVDHDAASEGVGSSSRNRVHRFEYSLLEPASQ
jgi:hypothetical protein